MLTDIAGVAVGHWTNAEAKTGCTVILLPEGTVGSGEVRGGAPGTREWDLLAPERTVSRLDAVVLTGGSAFGLAACDGVMQWCAERKRGFETAGGVVPIVVGAVLYDLAVGDGSVRPDASAGAAACDAAVLGIPHAVGSVGAGTGATTSKWRGKEHTIAGGLGTATVRSGEVVVSALIAVNAWGEVLRDGSGSGSLPAEDAARIFDETGFGKRKEASTDGANDPGDRNDGAPQNTTIGIVATNVALDKLGCLLVAQGAHDGFARAIWPVHTTVDGDAMVAVSCGAVTAPVDLVRLMAVEATARAIRASSPSVPSPTCGVPWLADGQQTPHCK